MKKLILLLAALVLVFTVDIATGIFYGNRIHLVFDASNFNNIISPVVGLLALIVNALVLILLLKQTKIIQSQNLKPFFIDRINRIEQEAKSITISRKSNGTKIKVQGFDKIVSLYIKTVKALRNRSDYKNFAKANNKNIKESNVEGANFYNLLYSLIYTTVGSSELCLFTKKINRLIESIQSSNLLKEDKEYLLGQINSDLLSTYNDLLELIKSVSNDSFSFNIPCIYEDTVDEVVPIINLIDTPFIIKA